LPDFAVPASLAVIVLGITASASWGAADFTGGWLSRRAPLLGVLLVTELVGLALALGAASLRGEPALGPEDLTWAVLSGLLAAIGLGGLYSGLAVGRMGIVAPVTGILAASIPVIAGSILEGLPGPLALAGIALAIVAVVVVSLSPGEDSTGPSGLRHALVAGTALGLANVTISRFGEGMVFGPLAVLRVVEAAAFTGVILVRRPRPAWRLPRSAWRWVVWIGAADLLGNAAYVAATQTGALAVAAVLSSLYPIVTVLLATILLRERLGRLRAIGIGFAAIAIAMLAAGSGG
jgi:drug/metabolite transporter (DMT)-like permease